MVKKWPKISLVVKISRIPRCSTCAEWKASIWSWGGRKRFHQKRLKLAHVSAPRGPTIFSPSAPRISLSRWRLGGVRGGPGGPKSGSEKKVVSACCVITGPFPINSVQKSCARVFLPPLTDPWEKAPTEQTHGSPNQEKVRLGRFKKLNSFKTVLGEIKADCHKNSILNSVAWSFQPLLAFLLP